MEKKGRIFLIPTPIGEAEGTLPAGNREILRGIDYFIVENLRTARRFLSRMEIGKPIDSLDLRELNEHTRAEEIASLLEPVLMGTDAGILSEAGVPAVADPGTEVVALAHRNGVEVVPLVGPSSVLLAVMASGLNGQSFAFNGYLPVKQPQRSQAIRHFEARAWKENQPQLFIEAPYRNGKLFEEILSVCRDQTMLSLAVDLMQPGQYIRTLPVAGWRKIKPELHKRPAIFILGKL